MTKLKYLHVCSKISDGMKNAFEEYPRRGGMYNWLYAFQGDIKTYDSVDDFEKYDVVQLNMSPVDSILIPELRERIPKSSSTMLVLNNDYVAETWGTLGWHPKEYIHYQKQADMLFGTEPYQVSCMNDGAYVLPHPHDIKNIKRIGIKSYYPEDKNVGFMYHWWEGRTYPSSLLGFKLKEKYGVNTRIYAYNGQKDESVKWAKVMFDEHMSPMNYPEYVNSIMTNKFIVELSSCHTYGRNTVDTAALGVPTMGTDRVYSMTKCFPKMIADPFDFKKQMQIADNIMNNRKWLDEQIEYASNACEYFNYDNSKKRFLDALEDARKRCGK